MKQTLKKGDIIIFKAEEDWLSKAIAWFTKSDASHAAMVYSEDSIVEVGAYGIGVHKVNFSDGDGVYVMRLTCEPDSAPLIRSADAYLNAKVRYDFPALFILAGLLIYQRITKSSRLLNAANRLLAAAGVKLDKMIQQTLLHHSEPAMVCSQLVYQIFYDCGEPYRIQITNGCVLTLQTENKESSSIRLFDLLPHAPNFSNSFYPEFTASDLYTDLSLPSVLTDGDIDDIVKEFYFALCESENTDLSNNTDLKEQISSDLSSTLALAEHFLSSLQHLLQLLDCKLPLESMFVTPGDLVYHAENLKNMGTLELTRLHSDMQP